jgi:hypothetical protein
VACGAVSPLNSFVPAVRPVRRRLVHLVSSDFLYRLKFDRGKHRRVFQFPFDGPLRVLLPGSLGFTCRLFCLACRIGNNVAYLTCAVQPCLVCSRGLYVLHLDVVQNERIYFTPLILWKGSFSLSLECWWTRTLGGLHCKEGLAPQVPELG